MKKIFLLAGVVLLAGAGCQLFTAPSIKKLNEKKSTLRVQEVAAPEPEPPGPADKWYYKTDPSTEPVTNIYLKKNEKK